MSLERRSQKSIELTPIGMERFSARLRVMKAPRRRLPEIVLLGVDGKVQPTATEPGRWVEYEISAVGPTIIQW